MHTFSKFYFVQVLILSPFVTWDAVSTLPEITDSVKSALGVSQSGSLSQDPRSVTIKTTPLFFSEKTAGHSDPKSDGSFVDKVKDFVGMPHESSPVQSVQSSVPSGFSSATNVAKETLSQAHNTMASAYSEGTQRAGELGERGKQSITSAFSTPIQESNTEGFVDKLKSLVGLPTEQEPQRPVLSTASLPKTKFDEDELAEKFKRELALSTESITTAHPSLFSSVSEGMQYATDTMYPSAAAGASHMTEGGKEAFRVATDTIYPSVSSGILEGVGYVRETIYPTVAAGVSQATEGAKVAEEYVANTINPALSTHASMATDAIHTGTDRIRDTIYPTATSVYSQASDTIKQGINRASTGMESASNQAGQSFESISNTQYPTMTGKMASATDKLTQSLSETEGLLGKMKGFLGMSTEFPHVSPTVVRETVTLTSPLETGNRATTSQPNLAPEFLSAAYSRVVDSDTIKKDEL